MELTGYILKHEITGNYGWSDLNIWSQTPDIKGAQIFYDRNRAIELARRISGPWGVYKITLTMDLSTSIADARVN